MKIRYKFESYSVYSDGSTSTTKTEYFEYLDQIRDRMIQFHDEALRYFLDNNYPNVRTESFGSKVPMTEGVFLTNHEAIEGEKGPDSNEMYTFVADVSYEYV